LTPDTYLDFAGRYDRFFEDFGKHPPRVVTFFRKLFAENEVHSVLDCACGTGHDLVLFHNLGVEVHGSDVSPAMLECAAVNLSERGLDIPLKRADYRDLPQDYDRKFDAVLCLSSSILEMPDEREVLRAFKSMGQVLNPGGILVLTQGTTDKQWKEKPRFIPVVSRNDFSRVFVIDYEGSGARYNVLDIFHGVGTYDFRVWGVDYRQMLLRDDFERLLTEAGFTRVLFYGSYTFEPYTKTSSDLLITVGSGLAF
jgi:SAM-dependent methyltransferase